MLEQAGFDEPVEVSREPLGMMDEHSHPFESKALVLCGEIALNIDGRETVYRQGDVFHLSSGERHVESYGPRGVRYLVGRK